MAISRANHFKYRRSDDKPAIALTGDDDRILLEVWRHDIVDSKTIYALLAPRTPDRIGRRLRKLHLTGFLDRLSQLEEIHVPGGGSLPVAYSLGPAGARRIEEVYRLKPKSRRPRERNTRLSAPFVQHALERARFLVRMRKSCEGRDDVEFLYPDEIWSRFAPEIFERERLPSVLKARVNWHGYGEEEGTIPDGFFMLHYPKLEGKNRRAIFLEIDRGTETIDPGERKVRKLKFWKDTSVLRKFVVYAYAHLGKVHVREFGVPTFQVLMVTTTPARVAAMQAAYTRHLAAKPHHVPPIRFLFIDQATIEATGDLISAAYQDGERRKRQLL